MRVFIIWVSLMWMDYLAESAMKTETDINVISFVPSKRTPKSFMDLDRMKLVRIRGGSIIKGTIEIITDISNDMEMEAFIYKFQGNEYRLTPFKFARAKSCDYIKKDVYILPGTMKDFNIPYECPIKAGNYTGQNTLDMNIPRNFDGQYKIVFNVYHMGELRGSTIVVVEIHHYLVE